MDARGNIVHQWQCDFASAFDESDFAAFPQQPDMLHTGTAPTSTPTATCSPTTITSTHYPYGYGLVNWTKTHR